MRYLIFLILAGFTGVTAWGQTSTTARPMAVNDTLTEDSTYALQEVVVRTSPVKRKADRFILSVPPAQNKDGRTPSTSARSMVVRRADFHQWFFRHEGVCR